jgi:regulator of sigma E protease
MSILIFLLILSILVLVHEFGHFIAAKKNGVLVEEFGIGFPPRLFGIKIKETVYSVNLIPLGGFVKLYGEEYDEMSQKAKGKRQNQVILGQKSKKKAVVYKHPWQ